LWAFYSTCNELNLYDGLFIVIVITWWKNILFNFLQKCRAAKRYSSRSTFIFYTIIQKISAILPENNQPITFQSTTWKYNCNASVAAAASSLSFFFASFVMVWKFSSQALLWFGSSLWNRAVSCWREEKITDLGYFLSIVCHSHFLLDSRKKRNVCSIQAKQQWVSQ